MAFDEDSQLVVPPSFVALYVPAGRYKPSVPWAQVHERHELCEDLASTLVENANATLHRLQVDERDVLERMQAGLLEPESGLIEGEAHWVVGRLAELLGWPWDSPLLPAPVR